MVSGANIWCSENISGAYKVSGAAALSRTLIQWWFARSAAPSQPSLHNTDPPTCPSLSLSLSYIHYTCIAAPFTHSFPTKPSPLLCVANILHVLALAPFFVLLSSLVPAAAGCTGVPSPGILITQKLLWVNFEP